MAFTLDAMSIYGQDTRMLEKLYYNQDTLSTAVLSRLPDSLPEYRSPSRSLFLALPLELRQQIYMYVLPRTYNHQSKGTVWLRGSTNLLATNSQIHDEASPFIYSMNPFLIDVCYDCATFDYRWSLVNGLFPKRRLAFPEQLGDRYIALLRNIQISIHIIDPYTGMIKFNYGGSGLMDGLRQQTQFLCQSLSRIPEIRCLGISLQDNTYTTKSTQRVLEPFLDLKNVRQVTLAGDIEPLFKEALCRHLNGTNKAISLSDLPYEIRLLIYRCLLPEFTFHISGLENWSRHRPPTTLSSIVALSCTNHSFYAEVQAFIFQSLRNLKLNIYQDLTYRFSLSHHPPLRARKPRSLPIASFQTSISKPALSHLRALSISFTHIPLDIRSPRYKSLESFIDLLVLVLESAPLNCLHVDYVIDQKSSSGDSSKVNVQPLNALASSTRSLDLELANTQISDQNSNSHRAMELWLAESSSRITTTSTVASPIATTPTSTQFPSPTLQTPPILYLVAKFNPLMAKVKTKANGHVGVQRRNSSMDDDGDCFMARSDSTGTRRNNQVSFEDIIETSGKLSGRARRSASPQNGDLTKSRSSSAKRRSRAMQVLFTDVPL